MIVKPLHLYLSDPSSVVNEHTKLASSMMVYRIYTAEKSYTGIVLGVDIANFTDDTIVHHEQTIPSKVEQQIKMVRAAKGLLKPILLTHRQLPAIAAVIEQITTTTPTIDVHIDKYHSRHQLWPIQQTAHIQTIEDTYAEVEHAYIVDGHHRTAAIQALGKTGSVRHGLCAMFDVGALDILPFHRVVQTPLPCSTILDKLKNISKLEEIDKLTLPRHANELIALIDRKIYRLNWNADLISADQVASLDVNLLSLHVLKNILGFTSERDSNIKYLEGNKTAEEIAANLGNNELAFLLHPIDIEDLIQITDSQRLLPPKSTWFLPRMASQLVRMAFED